jgi:hypothetical protein
MSTGRGVEPSAALSFVSTGRLPAKEFVSAMVVEAYERFKSNNERGRCHGG